uniref:Uncharacterized protein n=1 Tax=Branchiostoma floridae TaxID=7739 RepID=C3XYA7_BRAFL|eukprot:XP_002610782.1 hypothetical protein BRAFLDRAFT_91574 [Branchiostoma floridae]
MAWSAIFGPHAADRRKLQVQPVGGRPGDVLSELACFCYLSATRYCRRGIETPGWVNFSLYILGVMGHSVFYSLSNISPRLSGTLYLWTCPPRDPGLTCRWLDTDQQPVQNRTMSSTNCPLGEHGFSSYTRLW